VCVSPSCNALSCPAIRLSCFTGTYTDWVVHSKLAYTLSSTGNTGGGFIQIWRNNELLVSADNLLTSYNQSEPPYMKFGSYVESWKKVSDTSQIGENWASVTYKALRLGDADSSYDEVRHATEEIKYGHIYCKVGL
jgi:hypothetical protein